MALRGQIAPFGPLDLDPRVPWIHAAFGVNETIYESAALTS